MNWTLVNHIATVFFASSGMYLWGLVLYYGYTIIRNKRREKVINKNWIIAMRKLGFAMGGDKRDRILIDHDEYYDEDYTE